jgi:hypothetical protein
MSSGNPFGYVFDQKHWFVRLLGAAGFLGLALIIGFIVFRTMFVPVLLSDYPYIRVEQVLPTNTDTTALVLTYIGLSAAGIIVGAIVCGYMLQLTDNIARGADSILPRWAEDFARRTWQGFRFGIITFVWALPGSVLVAIDTLQSGSLTDSHFALLRVLAYLYGIFLLLVVPLIAARFAISRRLVDALNIGETLSTWRWNTGRYSYVLILELGAVFVAVSFAIGALLFNPLHSLGQASDVVLRIVGFMPVVFGFLLCAAYFFFLVAGIWGFAYRDVLTKAGQSVPAGGPIPPATIMPPYQSLPPNQPTPPSELLPPSDTTPPSSTVPPSEPQPPSDTTPSSDTLPPSDNNPTR